MIDIVQMGMGPLGRKMVKAAVERGCFRIVGAVDTDPDLVGRELGALCDTDPLGMHVSGSLAEAMRDRKAQVALVTTVSSIVTLEAQVKELARAALHIVSTCAVTLNTVRSVLAAQPGLRTMATIPPVGFFAQLG